MGGVVDHGSDEWSVALGSTESKRNRTRIVRHTICKTDNDLLDGSVLYSNWYDICRWRYIDRTASVLPLCVTYHDLSL